MQEKKRKREENLGKKVEYAFNGMITNQMVQIHPSKNHPKVDAMTDEAMIEIGTAKIYIEEYSTVTSIRQSVWKLLDFITIEFTKHQGHFRCKKDLISSFDETRSFHFSYSNCSILRIKIFTQEWMN